MQIRGVFPVCSRINCRNFRLFHSSRNEEEGEVPLHGHTNSLSDFSVPPSGKKSNWITRRPDRIFLVRHGQSWGNVDETMYERVPDNQIQLTTAGMRQADECGAIMKKIIEEERIKFFVSPYKRTVQTFHGIARHFAGPYDGHQYTFSEEPRLREQDFGNLQNYAQMQECRIERAKFGAFYYRFPQGESGADVFDRVSSFIETLHREMLKPHNPPNFVFVSHGITLRLFLMRYFKWSVDYFHQLSNPTNCQILLLKKLKNGKYVLAPHGLETAEELHEGEHTLVAPEGKHSWVQRPPTFWNPLLRPPKEKTRSESQNDPNVLNSNRPSVIGPFSSSSQILSGSDGTDEYDLY